MCWSDREMIEPPTPPQGLSAVMIQDWTELVRQLISRSPLQALQV